MKEPIHHLPGSQENRNVLGGYDFWTAIFPFLGFLVFVLGWFTVAIETFLRRDFGERYFSRINFFAGLLILFFWTGVSKLGVLFRGARAAYPFPGMEPVPPPSVKISGMAVVLLLFLVLSGYHFFTIWWRNVNAKPLHSLDAGTSWLNPLGKLLMGIINIVVGLLYGVYALTLPSQERVSFPQHLPVIRDYRYLTERFVEPLVVGIVAIVCMSLGAWALSSWLLFSVIALVIHSELRHVMERNYFLGIRDKTVIARYWREALAGDSDVLHIQGSVRNVVNQIALQAEQSPEMVKEIRQESPSLADAMEALNPKLRNLAAKESNS